MKAFPKYPTAQYKKVFDELLVVLDFIRSAGCTLQEFERTALLQKKLDELPALNQKDTTGLRLDFTLTNTTTSEVKWGDVTVVNTTSTGCVQKELKAIRSRHLSKQIAADLKMPDVLRLDPSPALKEREVDKCEKYSRLMLIGEKQHRDGKRVKAPQFAPVAVSNFG